MYSIYSFKNLERLSSFHLTGYSPYSRQEHKIMGHSGESPKSRLIVGQWQSLQVTAGTVAGWVPLAAGASRAVGRNAEKGVPGRPAVASMAALACQLRASCCSLPWARRPGADNRPEEGGRQKTARDWRNSETSVKARTDRSWPSDWMRAGTAKRTLRRD